MIKLLKSLFSKPEPIQKPIIMPKRRGYIHLRIGNESGIVQVEEISRDGNISECKVIKHNFHPVFNSDIQRLATMLETNLVGWSDINYDL